MSRSGSKPDEVTIRRIPESSNVLPDTSFLPLTDDHLEPRIQFLLSSQVAIQGLELGLLSLQLRFEPLVAGA
jgi:hypothetical protein